MFRLIILLNKYQYNINSNLSKGINLKKIKYNFKCIILKNFFNN